MSQPDDGQEPPQCGYDTGTLYCAEPPHEGGWHYDQYDDVTWRAGNHLQEVQVSDGESDRYRKALQKIARTGDASITETAKLLARIAHRALNDEWAEAERRAEQAAG